MEIYSINLRKLNIEGNEEYIAILVNFLMEINFINAKEIDTCKAEI